MAVKSSGQLSFNTDIVGEFGGTAPHNLSEYKRGGSLVPSGPSANSSIPTTNSNIQFSDFYGSVKSVSLTMSNYTQTGLDLESWAIAEGWNETDPVILTIDEPSFLYSINTSTPALIITSAFDNLLTIENYGTIMGMGGQGGYRTSSATIDGGDAIGCNAQNVIINNYGDILGGGGGGRGARDYNGNDTAHGGGGAGGGRGGGSLSGRIGGAGGAPGAYGSNGTSSYEGYPGRGGAQGGSGAGGFPNNGGGGGGGGRIPPSKESTLLVNQDYRGVGYSGNDGGISNGNYSPFTRAAGNGVNLYYPGGGGGFGQPGGANWYGDPGGAAGKAISGTGSWTVGTNTGVIAGSTQLPLPDGPPGS